MQRFLAQSGRFSLIFIFVKWFVATSFLLRLVFLAWHIGDVSGSLPDTVITLLVGFFFDLGTVNFIVLPAIIYTAFLPGRFIGGRFDRIFTWLFSVLSVFVLTLVFFAEVTFWEEFSTRFNFIAVDYLIYTHEVIANIRESYPLPLLIGGVALLTGIFIYIFYRRGAFQKTFASQIDIRMRFAVLAISCFVALLFGCFISNNDAEWSPNRYNSEISKSGVYSFFAAMRNNRMDYDKFYTTISNESAFATVRRKLRQPNSLYIGKGFSIKREINDSVASDEKKNVVFILVESLSGSFMGEFGNKEHITPFLDSLAQRSLFFENLYATGTRTVRGMEAVTLCIPPTPGQSIVKRPENTNLYTVSNVFSGKGYSCNFLYGGDGYFDNMNAYFGGNGFNIYDRGSSVLPAEIKTERHHIPDKEVTFENAWGICDEDIFNKMLAVADEEFSRGKPFFNFVMTTSNHRPYTYPEGKIDIRSGKNRQGAVKYTDFALSELFKKAERKPWFKNTVFVIIADHCAKSAGKDEIDVANYRIPAFIVNLPEAGNRKIAAQCSQIDLFPTLFSLLHWDYRSNFFGKSVFEKSFEPRAFVATYRKLALLKGNRIMVLSDQHKQAFYRWDQSDNLLTPRPMDKQFLEETIAWYQSADYLFINKRLK